MPYGWQFKDEKVSIASAKEAHINCFGLISRDNKFIYKTTRQKVTADFIIEQLDWLSWHITRETVIVGA